MKNTNISSIKLIIGIAAVVLALFAFKFFSERTVYNDGIVNGNTASNLYNEGTVCEHDGLVYFANPNDNNRLYSMNLDESDIKKVNDDRVFYINADDNYLYYCRDNNNDEGQMSFLKISTHSLCRTTKKGKKVKILDDAVCSHLSLIGNDLYYVHYDKASASTLYKVDIAGNDPHQVINAGVDPSGTTGNEIYYCGVIKDHYVHRLKPDGSDSIISNELIYQPVLFNGVIYGCNLSDEYKLCSIDLNGGSLINRTEEGVSHFNITNDYIFYQTMPNGDEPAALYVLDMNTGARNLIMTGEYKNICLTSRYLYFKEFNGNKMYHVNYSNGDFVPGEFSPIVEMK